LFIFFLPAISFFESKVVICLCSAYAYAVFMLMYYSFNTLGLHVIPPAQGKPLSLAHCLGEAQSSVKN
jgi:hypothetical protein